MLCPSKACFQLEVVALRRSHSGHFDDGASDLPSSRNYRKSAARGSRRQRIRFLITNLHKTRQTSNCFRYRSVLPVENQTPVQQFLHFLAWNCTKWPKSFEAWCFQAEASPASSLVSMLLGPYHFKRKANPILRHKTGEIIQKKIC